jgi:hypothetical protein
MDYKDHCVYKWLVERLSKSYNMPEDVVKKHLDDAGVQFFMQSLSLLGF